MQRTLLVFLALVCLPRLAFAAVIIGDVVEQETRLPVSGARVALTFLQSDPPRTPFQHRRFSTTTDAFGRFEFEGLEAGRYQLEVEREQFARTTEAFPTIEIARRERHRVETITLEREAVIVGRVLAEDGLPLANARVQVVREWIDHRSGEKRFSADIRTATLTNELGEFRLTRLQGGDHYVLAEPRQASAAPQVFTHGWTSLSTYFPQTADPAEARSIAVASGTESEPVTIHIVGAPSHEISGTVVDDLGRPVVNARLSLVLDDSTNRSIAQGQTRDSRTDESGQFAMSELLDGEYLLLVARPVVIAVSREPLPENVVTGGASVMVSCGTGNSRGKSVVYTETRNGVTTRHNFMEAVEMLVTIRQAGLAGLRVVVPSTP